MKGKILFYFHEQGHPLGLVYSQKLRLGVGYLRPKAWKQSIGGLTPVTYRFLRRFVLSDRRWLVKFDWTKIAYAFANIWNYNLALALILIPFLSGFCYHEMRLLSCNQRLILELYLNMYIMLRILCHYLWWLWFKSYNEFNILKKFGT